MPNQHTIRLTGSRARTRKLVTLNDQERYTIERGAALLGEAPAETLRAGGMERAARAIARALVGGP